MGIFNWVNIIIQGRALLANNYQQILDVVAKVCWSINFKLMCIMTNNFTLP